MGLLSYLFGIRPPRPDPDAPAAPALPCPPANAATNATGGSRRHEHFLSCLATVPSLAPRDASVRAFLTWLQDLDEAGDWEQSELLQDYESICDLTNVEAMPGKWFGRALEANGCRRWQAELVKDGRRWRPYMVRIPETLSKVGTSGHGQIIAMRPVLRDRTRIAASLPKSGWPGRGAYRADIGQAVANG